MGLASGGNNLKKLEFCCPSCRSMLATLDGGFLCSKCGQTWSLADGIPNFLSEPIYWGELSQDEMKNLLQEARAKGWSNAMQRLKSAGSNLYRYATDEGRARWRFLMPITPESRILDLGAGYGSLSIPLARVAGEVVSVDCVVERAHLINCRAEEQGLSNITPVLANVLELPFAEGQFDLVIMNGMLEWVAIAETTMHPREVQISFLSGVRQMLRPGGWVYIGIENRFGLCALKGMTDHGGLRYTSLMPRWLADLCMRLTVRKAEFRQSHVTNSYRTYTYSYKGYKDLLRLAGYKEMAIYECYPGYNEAEQVIPLEHRQAYQYFLSHVFKPRSWKGQLFRRLMSDGTRIGLHRLIASSFGIMAR